MSDYILIVDDEYEIREILRLMLTRVGHPVRHAVNGKQALDIIREEIPAIILLDIMMPVLDGREMFREIKADPALRNIPVLFISAISRSRANIPGLEEGDPLVDFIEKSDFTPQGLMTTIHSMLEKAGRPARPANSKLPSTKVLPGLAG